ncbi:MAG: YceI family protein [Verrucomicrobiota bacterium]
MVRAATLALLLFTAAAARAEDAPLDVPASSLTFTGHAFLHDFHGAAKVFRGQAQIDPARPEMVRGAVLDIDAAKLTTFESARDQNMDAWLHTDTNTAIRFELAEVKPLDGDLAHATKESPAHFAIAGTFTLNKVPKPLKTTAVAWREGKHLVVDGAVTIDTEDHALPQVKQMFLTVDPKVDIAFHLVFDLP